MKNYKQMGREAAQAFLNEQVPLNRKIAEMTVRDSLTSEEINRVCEAANHTVTAAMYQKSAQAGADLYHSFPIADSLQVKKLATTVIGINRKAAVGGDTEDYLFNILPQDMDKAADEHTEEPSCDDILRDMRAIENAIATTNNRLAWHAKNASAILGKLDVDEESLYRMVVERIKRGDQVEDVLAEIYLKLQDDSSGYAGRIIPNIVNRLQGDGLITRTIRNSDHVRRDLLVMDNDSDMMRRVAHLRDKHADAVRQVNAAVLCEEQATKLAGELQKQAVLASLLATGGKALIRAVPRVAKVLGKGVVSAARVIKNNAAPLATVGSGGVHIVQETVPTRRTFI